MKQELSQYINSINTKNDELLKTTQKQAAKIKSLETVPDKVWVLRNVTWSRGEIKGCIIRVCRTRAKVLDYIATTWPQCQLKIRKIKEEIVCVIVNDVCVGIAESWEIDNVEG